MGDELAIGRNLVVADEPFSFDKLQETHLLGLRGYGSQVI
jgi:hypothetical protein